MTIFFPIIQFLPLTAFVITARVGGLTTDAWPIAFQVGGLLAVAETLLLVWRRTPLNRLLLGANVFLIIGAISFALQIDFILRLYGQAQEAALFGSVFLVGIITTFWTDRGFVEVKVGNRQKIIQSSIALLIVTGLCLGMSVFFRGNVWLGGTLPFVVLIVARYLLQRRLGRQSSS